MKYSFDMYIRSKKNASGSESIQIIEKKKGKYVVLETIGAAKTEEEKKKLFKKAEVRKNELEPPKLFSLVSEQDNRIGDFLAGAVGPTVENIGPELILGKIFESIGLGEIDESLFRHMVLARLTYPVSKLKTVEYLQQHRGISIDISSIYRFLDRFYAHHKAKVEKIIFEYSRKILGEIQVVFYDMTTLYFEAEDEDELRKIGFSKDGKFQCPQIMIGLLVGENGYPIGYEVFEGNTFEGKTIIPVIRDIEKKYNLPKPIVVADSGLLSRININELVNDGYSFILGARIKNETEAMKRNILEHTKHLEEGKTARITKADGTHLIIGFSIKRAKKDAYNREKGIQKLREKISGGYLTKAHINNRGCNKFLVFGNKTISISLDSAKIEADVAWDGLKGYVTNISTLTDDEIIERYQHLWKIEKAFRISKTDLRIRPIFHRKEERIKAHLCVAFAAYAVYKELERLLAVNKIDISPAKAIELSKTIFQITFLLPDSEKPISIFNKLSDLQKNLLNLKTEFRVSQ